MHPSAHDTERISIRDDVIPLQSPITMTDGSTVTSFPVKAGEVNSEDNCYCFVNPFPAIHRPLDRAECQPGHLGLGCCQVSPRALART